MPTIEIPYTPQPRQRKFHECPADEVLYGGAAGGGKSKALVMDALANALEYPGCRIVMFRRTYGELDGTLVMESLNSYPQTLGRYNSTRRRWTFINGSVIDFSYLEQEKDVHRYQGWEFDFIYFDELTHFTESQYTYMLSRLRGTNPKIHRQVKSATNPGGVGHHWVKRRFIDPAPPETVWTAENGKTRCFIPAKIFDNEILMRNDPGYIQNLMSLDENTRRQLLEGDWDVFAGQFFTEFSRDIHVVAPFKIPAHWRKIRAMDEGYNDPFVCLWLAFDEHNNCYVYREFVKTQLLSEEQARAVLELTGDEKIDYSVGDTSFWNKSKTSGESPADVFFKLGLPMIKATKERVNGWMKVRDWLHVFDDTDPVTGQKFKNSRLKIFSTCTHLIESLPAMVVDENDPEDIAPHPLDHAPDALRYGLMSWPMPAKPPEPAPPSDPMQRWLYDMEKLHEKRIKSRKRRVGW